MPLAAFLHPENAPKSLAAGASPDPTGGAIQRSPRPLAGLRGPTSEGRGDFGPSQCWRQIDAPAWDQKLKRKNDKKIKQTDEQYKPEKAVRG